MQGFGVGFFSKRFTDHFLLKSAVAVMSLSYLLLVSHTHMDTILHSHPRLPPHIHNHAQSPFLL